MQLLSIDFPSTVTEAYKQLSSIPYYKVDETTYAFAAHIIEKTDETKDDTYLQCMLKASAYPNIVQIFQKSIDKLSNHTILASDLLAWTTYRKAKGTVLEYQNILASTYYELLEDSASEIINKELKEHIEVEKDVSIWDIFEEVYVVKNMQQTNNTNDENPVLNHNNPFADVSIRNQQFIYASDSDQFGTLSLNTSHTLTRIQHDEDTSYLVMQPGFKIKTTNSIQMKSPQEIIFDDELTNEIAQQDDKIYVYID